MGRLELQTEAVLLANGAQHRRLAVRSFPSYTLRSARA